VTENILTANAANMKLLQYVLSKLPKKPQFLELSDVGDLMARETVFLHSVHLGEVGWAIDRCECVSLYIISRDGARLTESVFFVEEKTEEPMREDSVYNSLKRRQVEDKVDAYEVDAYEIDYDEFEDYVDRDWSELGDTDQDEDSEELNEKVDNGKAVDDNRPIPVISRTSPISPETTACRCPGSNLLIRQALCSLGKVLWLT
jgi:hypothetical protein